MIVLVTGKSGSGKSTFAKALAKETGFLYVDVDEIGHKIYKDSKLLSQLKMLFGEEIFESNEVVNRKKLGRIVFQERDSLQVKMYNAITLDYIQREVESIVQENKNVILDWVNLPCIDCWNSFAYKILVKATNDDARFKKLLERDEVDLEYLKLRDKASVEYDESEFNYVVLNDYKSINNEKAIDAILKDMNNVVEFEAMGTKSPFALQNGACPSYFIKYGETKLLLDCGSGSHRFFNMNNLDDLNIIISHLHRDHYNDLFNYMYSSYALRNLGRVKNKTNIFLPSTPKKIVDDIKNESLKYSNLQNYNESTKLQFKDVFVEFLKVEHSQKMDCYAMKIVCGKKSIVYTGDVSYSSKQNLVEFAKGCDVLICESSLLQEYRFPEVNSHLTAYQAGVIAKEAKVKKLMLTHFWGEEDVEKYLAEARQEFKNTIVLKEQSKFYI